MLGVDVDDGDVEKSMFEMHAVVISDQAVSASRASKDTLRP
jgi:hypothetical protein